MKLKKDLVNIYYHKNCSDGFGAAWAAYKYFGDKARYFPISHHQEVVVSYDSINYFLDISPKESDLKRLEESSKEIIILDHHISSFDYLKDKEYYTFDINHSGCVLAWKHFFPEEEVPNILRYVEDRDLWKNELENSNEIFLFLNTFETKFEEWDKCNDLLTENFDDCVEKGKSLTQYREFIINKLKNNKHKLRIGGVEVYAINSPFFQSYMLSTMYKEEPFMACYHFDGERYVFSLRSSNESEYILSDIAKIYNGGGHKNAAGFSVDKLWHLDYINYKRLSHGYIKTILQGMKKCVKWLYEKFFIGGNYE